MGMYLLVILNSAANGSMATLPDEAMLLLHECGLCIGITAQIAICRGI